MSARSRQGCKSALLLRGKGAGLSFANDLMQCKTPFAVLLSYGNNMIPSMQGSQSYVSCAQRCIVKMCHLCHKYRNKDALVKTYTLARTLSHISS